MRCGCCREDSVIKQASLTLPTAEKGLAMQTLTLVGLAVVVATAGVLGGVVVLLRKAMDRGKRE